MDVVWKSVGIVNARLGDRGGSVVINFGVLRKGTDEFPKVELVWEKEDCCVNKIWRKMSG